MSTRKCRICDENLETLYVNCEDESEGWFVCACGAVNKVTMFGGHADRRRPGRPFEKVTIKTISLIKESIVESQEELEEVLAL